MARAVAVVVVVVASGFSMWLGLWPFLCLSLLGSPCDSGCGRCCVCRFWFALWLGLWPFLSLSLLGYIVARDVAVVVFVASGLPCGSGFGRCCVCRCWVRPVVSIDHLSYISGVRSIMLVGVSTPGLIV